MTVNRRYVKVMVIFIMLSVLTGCWDSVEIDQRAFIIALGADVYEPTEEEVTLSGEGFNEELAPLMRSSRRNVESTFVFPKHMSTVTGESEVAYLTMSSIAESVYINRKQLATRTDVELYLGHLEAMLLGEAFVKDETLFREFLDAAEKEPLMSRRVSLAVVDGRAKDALNIKAKMEPNTGDLVSDLLSGTGQTDRAPITDFGRVAASLKENGNAVIPRITFSKDEIKVGGAAVIKDFHFVGWLGEIESLALNIIRNNIDSFGLNSYVENHLVPFDVTDAKTSYKLLQEDGRFVMEIEVMGEADIEQVFFMAKEDVLDPEYVKKVERAASGAVEQILEHTIGVAQGELETDVIHFEDYIKKFKPKLWKEIKEDWDTIFPNIETKVNVNIKIRRVGLAR